MNRLKNAPYLKDQPKEPMMEAVILVGAGAWSAYGKDGNGVGWQVLRKQIDDQEDTKPVILGSEQLTQLKRLRVARAEQKVIGLYQFGEMTQTELTALCHNLAIHTAADKVTLSDNAGQLSEDLSAYIARLREEQTQPDSLIELIADSASVQGDKQEKADNLKPYIKKRTIDGKKGLYRITPKMEKDTGEILEKTDWLSDCVEVVGIGKGEEEYFTMLSFVPPNERQARLLALPLKEIGERSGWQLLRMNGLNISNKTHLKTELADYLQDCSGKPVHHVVNVTGWQYGAYILPNGDVIGDNRQRVYFNGQSANKGGYSTGGSLESWQREIAGNVAKNHFMMLGVACALAAPLVTLVNAESFGVHLFGGSSSGKTTTANIASSIYGHPDEIRLSWFSTALALANEAQARNDGFMPLDEIGQGANKKHVEQTAYTLFNGIGKMQGAKEGGNRDIARWRTLAFSTGETDLETYLTAGGIKTNVGQLVRLLNIPITKACHFHRHRDGKAHADHLNQATRRHYGVVGREWIKLLIAEQAAGESRITTQYQGYLSKWLERLPTEASAQVKRVATRFALLETALQLAAPLTGWKAADNSEALLKAFAEWVNEFGYHSREERQVIEQAEAFLARFASRFIEFPINPTASEPKDIAGHRVLANTDRGTPEQFYVFKQVYVQDVIKGFNEKQASEILLGCGLLKQGDTKGYRYLTRLPSKIDPKRTRCYLLVPMSEDEDEATASD
ncbi:putative DNA primase/helicase [Pasteurella testudinis DSM 23072]|uniref:Putative DNA primase/helicase n=1 Tax=Pasteurella testudinis DSM 23072 TaxID=1122938 RepID=A0A1W1V2M2_9PAST|nr:DUF927 domain-containing protein [Pasteurella testudinis]SMB87526.1 putative DNA primase/helicase [Pasteurella testudinis DSM 23072]SUB50524.1 Superfamily II helicase and inactivated derivatives [Pasteurella testudinis]